MPARNSASVRSENWFSPRVKLWSPACRHRIASHLTVHSAHLCLRVVLSYSFHLLFPNRFAVKFLIWRVQLAIPFQETQLYLWLFSETESSPSNYIYLFLKTSQSAHAMPNNRADMLQKKAFILLH